MIGSNINVQINKCWGLICVSISLVPVVIGHISPIAAEFKVGGKKHVKFDGRDVPYNVWCISQGKGTDVSRGDI